MSTTLHSKTTVKRLADERDAIHRKQENKLAEINGREDPMPNVEERELLKAYRDDITAYDEQIADRLAAIEADDVAEETSKNMRRVLADGNTGVVEDGDGVVYRDKESYIFDYFITRQNVKEVKKITRQWGIGDADVAAAQQRLEMVERAPTNTLSSNVGGLTPPQHIAQIFQVINKTRNLVNAATHADLERGTLTYPQLDTKPVVAVQSSEKTEGGTTGLAVSMVTKTAVTYLGGGDLSWQAINWSTPNALKLWFDVIAADYALKTETAAASAVSTSGFLNNISSTIATTATFAEFMAAVGAGYGEVFANSGRIADTIVMAPDRFGYLLGMTSAAFTQFVSVGQDGVGPLRIVVSRGLNAGEIIVGDISALLCAETPDAPVEMQVVEPSIGGVEVGLIGAFVPAVVDNGAFASISTAS